MLRLGTGRRRSKLAGGFFFNKKLYSGSYGFVMILVHRVQSLKAHEGV